MSGHCELCNDSGEVAVSVHTLAYRGPGPVPDDARGVVGVPCQNCAPRAAWMKQGDGDE